MKHIFIINPVSGAGRGNEIGKKIENIAKDNGYEFNIHYTTKKNDATDIAKKYKDEENIIYSVGGDGTLNEVLNGIVGSKNMLSIIPVGSGNDFYRSIVSRKESKFSVDVGVVNGLYFLNNCAVGIDAEIGHNALLMKKKHIPIKHIYNASILYTFFRYKFKEIEFVLNEKKLSGKYTIVTIMNGKAYGGGWEMAPNAILDDGLFDVYFVDKVSKLTIPKLLFKVKKGTHEDSKFVHHVLSDKIKFKTKENVIVVVDGETLYDNEFEIKLLKNGVVIYNDIDLVNKLIN